MTHDADHDPEFEAFLRRRSPMHRRLSQIDHVEPSAELDRIVLNRARDAIGAPAQEPIYRKSRWAMPLGLAATLLIAFTVVLNIDHRRAVSPSQRASNASARLAETPAATPVPQLMARARSEAAGADSADMSADQAAESSSLPAPAEASDNSAIERRPRDEQKLAVKSEVAPAAPAAAASAEASSSEQPALAARGFAERPAESDRNDTAFPADPTAADIVSRRDTTTASSRSRVVQWGAASAAKAAPPPSPSPSSPTDFRASPEAWLLEIDRLRAAGRNEEADREIAAFRQAHPAHPGYSLAQPPTR